MSKCAFLQVSRMVGGLAVAALMVLGAAPAQAGPITDWDLTAIVGYTGSSSDLVVTFQLVEASTGRVIYQVTNNELTITDLGSEISYIEHIEVDHSAYSTDYTWSLVVDATGASGTVTIDEWEQVVDNSTTYSATTSSTDISGTVAVLRFIGEYSQDF